MNQFHEFVILVRMSYADVITMRFLNNCLLENMAKPFLLNK